MYKNNVNDEMAYIFDKKYICPVCDKEFTSKQVRTGKSHFEGTEEDLRPVYTGIDTIKYDVVMCPHCGYAAVLREFNNISSRQRKNIREEIASKYTPVVQEYDIYSYSEAIRRYKMALLTAMKKPSKLSEEAYLCLKLSWLYRGAASELSDSQTDGQQDSQSADRTDSQSAGQTAGHEDDRDTASQYKDRLLKFKEAEDNYTGHAYEGFTAALEKEYPPICNMDEMTLNYLMSVLAYKCGDINSAQRYAYMIISSRTAGASVKRKTSDLLLKIRESAAK